MEWSYPVLALMRELHEKGELDAVHEAEVLEHWESQMQKNYERLLRERAARKREGAESGDGS